MEIKCAGEILILLAEKAVFWPAKKTLIIADPHFGKSASFRSHGIAAPDTTETDLARLTHLILQNGAERLIILGDFLHARSGRTETTMCQVQDWCLEQRQTKIILISGNHDAQSGPPPADWCIEYFPDSVKDAPFTYCHHPSCMTGSYVLCGHLHPSVALGGKFGGGVRLPCFVFGNERAILPAFGSFTGTHIFRADAGDRLFGVGSGEIIQIPRRQKKILA